MVVRRTVHLTGVAGYLMSHAHPHCGSRNLTFFPLPLPTPLPDTTAADPYPAEAFAQHCRHRQHVGREAFPVDAPGGVVLLLGVIERYLG